MRIGYLECFAGLSGDMLLGALVDAGVPEALLAETAVGLDLGATLHFARVTRSGVMSSKARVMVNGHEADAPAPHVQAHAVSHSHTHVHAEEAPTHSHPHSHSHHHDQEQKHEHTHDHEHGRTLPAIRSLLQSAPIAEEARALALRSFELLGEAEASIHGVPLDQVHFHEVGGVDSIVDITCSAVGLTWLGVESWYCSAVNVGSGFVDCAHGRFPVPAPATAALLRGVPTYSEGPTMEMVTPTGAAILRALGCEFSRPVAAFAQIGYGAGSRDPKRFPNVVRLSIGEAVASAANTAQVVRAEVASARESIAVLQCAIDDQSPQVLAHAMQLALEHGALDAMSAPVTMKKGRLGTLLTILCRPEDAAEFEDLLFRETSTLGVRTRLEERRTLAREHVLVATAFGEIRIKRGSFDGAPMHAQPEFEDCRRCALEHRVPLKQVLDAAMRAWSERQEEAAHA